MKSVGSPVLPDRESVTCGVLDEDELKSKMN